MSHPTQPNAKHRHECVTSTISRNLNPHYRGRVRSGCLTCRGKKVKCDEQRPVCQRCEKSGRICVYKPRSQPQTTHTRSCSEVDNPHRSGACTSPQLIQDKEGRSQAPSYRQSNVHSPSRAPETFYWLSSPCDEDIGPVSQGITQGSDHTVDSFSSPQEPSTLSLAVSQDIYLCTTIDRWAADEALRQPSLSTFVNEVEAPILSTFDSINWSRFKIYAVHLCAQHKGVMTAVSALQSLYKARKNNISISKITWKLYRAARLAFDIATQDSNEESEIVLVIVLLLCLFEMIVFVDTGSSLGHLGPNTSFVRRLESYTSHENRSCLFMRISTWLRCIHTSGRHGGNPGILSASVLKHLPLGDKIPSLATLEDSTDAASAISDHLRDPMLGFYFQLQAISAEVANLSHYHRSRTESNDQDEVLGIITHIRSRMQSLWVARPSIMGLAPHQIQQHLSHEVGDCTIQLIGLCNASYHAEIVEIGRTLSDPPLASAEAKSAMQSIREIVDGDWFAYSSDGRLNSGYLRPLFLCAIESIRLEDSRWAIERLRQIKDPICSSDFFATFAEELTAAQRSKGRRVASKIFCRQSFGIPPPFLV